MIGLGTQEFVILAILLLVIVFILGYFVGKGKGFKKGLDYARSLKESQH
jgi:hypothetical protein